MSSKGNLESNRKLESKREQARASESKREQERASRVPQLTCIWMSGASGLGKLTRESKREPERARERAIE